MRWLIRRQPYEFVYDSKTGEPDTRWDDLQAAIAMEAESGWEPWALDMKSTFNANFDSLSTLGHVWYKMRQE